MKRLIAIPIALILASFAEGCASAPPLSPWELKPSSTEESTQEVMSAPFIVRIWKGGDSSKAVQTALNELRRISRLADQNDPKSEISRVNQLAYKSPVKISRELFDLLAEGQRISQRSEGVFDVTFLRIQEETEKNGANAGLSSGVQDSADDVARQLKTTVGSKNLTLDPVASTVRFNKPGMKLGILGLARGYAVQKTAEKLIPFRLPGFAVLGGGVFAASGKALFDKNLMCVEHPNELGTCAYRVVPKNPGAIFLMGTSAVFERPGHIYNAKNGLRKARTGGVTFVGTDGAAIQAAATAAGAMDNTKTLQFIDKKDGLPITGVFYDSDFSITLRGTLEPYAKTVPVKPIIK